MLDQLASLKGKFFYFLFFSSEPTYETVSPILCPPLQNCSLSVNDCPFGFYQDVNGCLLCQCLNSEPLFLYFNPEMFCNQILVMFTMSPLLFQMTPVQTWKSTALSGVRWDLRRMILAVRCANASPPCPSADL